MKITTLEFAGLDSALTAMRLPMKSGNKSDSCWSGKMDDDDFQYMISPYGYDEYNGCYRVGPNDHKLSMKLCNAGSDHRKHIRLIDVWVEIQAPLFWWKEFDTYRFGVDKVSESTMHTLMKKELTVDDFELNDMATNCLTERKDAEYYPSFIDDLEDLRKYGDFESVNAMLPQSYLQTRICKISYEALRNMYHARKNHKLKQWHQFCEWIETLPYSEFITGVK